MGRDDAMDKHKEDVAAAWEAFGNAVANAQKDGVMTLLRPDGEGEFSWQAYLFHAEDVFGERTSA